MKTAVLIFFALFLLPVQQEKEYAKQREAMVKKQIERRGIKDSATLAAMRKVPRHLFVPNDQMAHAYEDRPLPIGYGSNNIPALYSCLYDRSDKTKTDFQGT